MEPHPRPLVMKLALSEEEQLKHQKKKTDTAVLPQDKKSSRDESKMFTANKQKKREQWRQILVSIN